MCVCVCCLFGSDFVRLFLMSYLDLGLLFDNNLGKTQLDKIGVTCQLLGFVSGLGYFSDLIIALCVIREYICQNIMAKSKGLEGWRSLIQSSIIVCPDWACYSRCCTCLVGKDAKKTHWLHVFI